jgi:hypothetical protein
MKSVEKELSYLGNKINILEQRNSKGTDGEDDELKLTIKDLINHLKSLQKKVQRINLSSKQLVHNPNHYYKKPKPGLIFYVGWRGSKK